ncbi:MAG: SRPBCC family protein [Bacillota bacterium]|nr:SRPBCC family protein [Bacillota bacterium]
MAESKFVYVTYIRTTPEKLWSALTNDTEFMQQYWFGTRCESRWTAGSSWKMVQADGSVSDAGEIVESQAPHRLVIRWRHEKRPELKAEGESLCTMELEPCGSAVKLTVTHTIGRENSKLIEAVSGGWPKILSNLKSLAETGSVTLQTAYPPQGAKLEASHA